MVACNADVPEERRIELRIGVNIGDVIRDETDIYGDGVNVAARLEGLAELGSICVSRAARDQVRDKLDIAFEDMGEQRLRNIARPVRVYRIKAETNEDGAPPTPASRVAGVARAVSNIPSLAVLPFQNMSGDPEQEYFADGMVEEVITALSRIKSFSIVARNSSFTYKGKAVDVKQVGRELGVRYVLEGSVRKAGNRVRITGQLIDTSTAAHLWADRFEGGLADIFDLQDQMTARVVGAITPKLEAAEIERAKRKPTESLDAYDYYLRAIASFYQWTRDGTAEALRLCYQAIELDPNFASAYGLASRCYVWCKTNGWAASCEQDVPETARLARRAVELGKDDAVALCAGGLALAYVVGDLDGGAAFLDRALVLNPSLALAWHFSGFVRILLGEPETAINHLSQAIRLSPFDPLVGRIHSNTACACFFAGRYEEASSWAEKALRERPNELPALRFAAASYGFAGRFDDARTSLERLRELDPAFCIANLKDRLPLRRAEDIARFAEGLRRAGLPQVINKGPIAARDRKQMRRCLPALV
jgi:adenylate cyclase